MVTKRFRNPRALSSALASLGMLQPQALGFLNRLVTLVSASNLYIDTCRVVLKLSFIMNSGNDFVKLNSCQNSSYAIHHFARVNQREK